MENLPKDKKIILFDGVCTLCNNAIDYIIKKDHKDQFVFASLQSDIGKKLTEERGIDTSQIDSMILIIPGEAYYVKSSAALQIFKRLKGAVSLSRIFLPLPESFRDSIYDLIARNRYRWFGKKETCRMPTPEEKAKFIE
ncbi:DCC1-like thiol-disulfide oxidoreductase family protein [Mesonia sp. MT50]|uniref:DCC1-like thiol-disulfide oxidoreductase family protein n=1 Tax=Mesonia profundi TaxID=3070998 RepID=A0ABU1A0N9_9FLAO|nr:DCC1-like thiol-disulfide oxidoreductase family protein [Mesonia profundi]MDQ7917273.1 DCC1-like thiol-disulfide oxidoreductase family protein [Mesonia profundi]